MTGLTKDQRVIVSLPGRKGRGVILEAFEKSYRVKLDEGRIERFSALRVKPESTRKPTAKLEPALFVGQIPVPSRYTAPEQTRAVPKPELPELCPAWRRFVKKFPCCNCGAVFGIEAHHEGKKDAFARKVRDTLTVPLHLECHTVYTAKNRLPIRIKPSGIYGEDDLRTREESLEILRAEQERLLGLVLARLNQQDRIEILSKGISKARGLAQLLGRIEGAV